MDPVVILVDNKTRDLPAASLIAHQIRSFGVECHLEPLEAFRAVLDAYRPGMIIFNHIFASHLAAWSRRLHEIGVLTAVLSNEGMYLREDSLKFNTGRYHANCHIDHFFCWNRVHRDELLRTRIFPDANVEIVGVPRFDFYFEPWSRLVAPEPRHRTGRPRVLACTNFGLSRFSELPREHGDRFFAGWKQMPIYKDYWGAIESHGKNRQRFLEYIDPLIKSGKYEITIRPHPGEPKKFYQDWYDRLSDAERGLVTLDAVSEIGTLILNCDLEISGESCTTAIESWIAGKPTLELEFNKHPLLFSEERSAGNVHCDDPAKIVEMVDRQLASPKQDHLKEIRSAYLEKWCANPDGKACARAARIATEAVKAKKPSDWSKLQLVDRRRAVKLRATRAIGQAYHYSFLLPLKSAFFKKKYAVRKFSYDKSIKPGDVTAARHRIEGLQLGQQARKID